MRIEGIAALFPVADILRQRPRVDVHDRRADLFGNLRKGIRRNRRIRRSAAARLLLSIQEKCVLVSRQPQMGRSRFELSPELRGFPVGNYLIFYRPASDGIEIIRVVHGARDIPELFD